MFEIVGDITNVQVIATGRGIRRLKNLRTKAIAPGSEAFETAIGRAATNPLLPSNVDYVLPIACQERLSYRRLRHTARRASPTMARPMPPERLRPARSARSSRHRSLPLKQCPPATYS